MQLDNLQFEHGAAYLDYISRHGAPLGGSRVYSHDGEEYVLLSRSSCTRLFNTPGMMVVHLNTGIISHISSVMPPFALEPRE